MNEKTLYIHKLNPSVLYKKLQVSRSASSSEIVKPLFILSPSFSNTPNLLFPLYLTTLEPVNFSALYCIYSNYHSKFGEHTPCLTTPPHQQHENAMSSMKKFGGVPCTPEVLAPKMMPR